MLCFSCSDVTVHVNFCEAQYSCYTEAETQSLIMWTCVCMLPDSKTTRFQSEDLLSQEFFSKCYICWYQRVWKSITGHLLLGSYTDYSTPSCLASQVSYGSSHSASSHVRAEVSMSNRKRWLRRSQLNTMNTVTGQEQTSHNAFKLFTTLYGQPFLLGNILCIYTF